MKTIKVTKTNFDEIAKNIAIKQVENFDQIDQQVQEIVKNVINQGDQALFEYTEKFDQVKLQELSVSKEALEKGCELVDDEFKRILERAKENIEDFHKKQIQNSWIDAKNEGIILGQLINPIPSVAIYVPGGKASYPSTVLMNAIPAKLAGVERIVMITPPQKDGQIMPELLYAAKIAGVDEIYKIGGAHSVAALAYGTETIKPVNKIVGPGNIYVARAKKLVFGKVDIDMIAGPSEICVIADETANPNYVAADLLSQAEHDEMASSFLVTTSDQLGKQVYNAVYEQLEQLERVEIAKQSIEDNAIIYEVEDLDMAFDLSNLIAPEHLELMIQDPMMQVSKVKNAGAVFLGSYSPEPLGDYFAGPNHTLPTSGTAVYSSPLGVYDFIKKSSLIYYNREALSKVKDDIIVFAEKEGLTAHGNSIKVRF